MPIYGKHFSKIPEVSKALEKIPNATYKIAKSIVFTRLTLKYSLTAFFKSFSSRKSHSQPETKSKPASITREVLFPIPAASKQKIITISKITKKIIFTIFFNAALSDIFALSAVVSQQQAYCRIGALLKYFFCRK